jgi:hypothetical protein
LTNSDVKPDVEKSTEEVAAEQHRVLETDRDQNKLWDQLTTTSKPDHPVSQASA